MGRRDAEAAQKRACELHAEQLAEQKRQLNLASSKLAHTIFEQAAELKTVRQQLERSRSYGTRVQAELDEACQGHSAAATASAAELARLQATVSELGSQLSDTQKERDAAQTKLHERGRELASLQAERAVS